MQKTKEQFNKTLKDWEREKVQIQKDLEQARREINSDRRNLHEELSRAKQEIARTRQELTSYKTMISLMEKEGLINSNDDYSIRYHAGELTINGKKQPTEIAEKYTGYLGDDVEITRQNGNFSINKNK
jgi:intergrase/recombinase